MPRSLHGVRTEPRRESEYHGLGALDTGVDQARATTAMGEMDREEDQAHQVRTLRSEKPCLEFGGVVSVVHEHQPRSRRHC